MTVGVAIASLGLGSCATIMYGTHQNIRFNSIPAGATVRVEGYPEIVTPGEIELWRKRSCVAVIQKEGYREVRVPISVDFNHFALTNILTGGIPGVMIDAFDGAMGELKPESVDVVLEPLLPEPVPSPVP
jgi:hypothetical protein